MYCLQVLVNLDVAKKFMISITNPSLFSKGTAFSTGIYVRQNWLYYSSEGAFPNVRLCFRPNNLKIRADRREKAVRL